MLVMSKNKRILADVCSIYVSRVSDKVDPNKVLGWNLVGSLPFGKTITLGKYQQESEAVEALGTIASDFEVQQV